MNSTGTEAVWALPDVPVAAGEEGEIALGKFALLVILLFMC